MAMRTLFVICGFFMCTVNAGSAQNLDSLYLLPLYDAVSKDTITLGDYSDKEYLLLIFTSNYCPYSRKYESRIKDFHGNYARKGVQLVLVNPNTGTNDSAEEMERKASQLDYQFPYVSDKDQKLTSALGARRTPEAYLIRKDVVLYRGAIDDNPQAPDYVEDKYLAQALDQALGGQEITEKDVKVIGCLIKRGG